MNRRDRLHRAALALEVVSLGMVISVAALLAWVAFGDRPSTPVTDDLGPGLAVLALLPLVPLVICGIAGVIRWWRAETDTPLIGYGVFAILMTAWQIPVAGGVGLDEVGDHPVAVALILGPSLFVLVTAAATIAVYRSRTIASDAGESL